MALSCEFVGGCRWDVDALKCKQENAIQSNHKRSQMSFKFQDGIIFHMIRCMIHYMR
jgi:hypothetical protein